MAIASDPLRSGRSQDAALGIASAGDRTRDFRRARRHSFMVRALRLGLPITAVAIVAGYVVTVIWTSGWGAHLAQLPMPRITPENLTMDQPRYEGFGKDGSSYVLNANTATQDFKTPTLIRLDGITGDFFDAKKAKTNLVATYGLFDQTKNELELHDGIDVVGETGMRARLKSATVYPKTSLIVSKEPVRVEMPSGTINANEMELRHKAKEATFIDQVVAHLKATKSGDPAAAEAAAKPVPPDPSGRLFGSSNQPIDVTSSRLDVNDAGKIAVFTGEVTAVQGESMLTTPELQVTYEGDATPGAGAAGAATPGATATPTATGSGTAKLRRLIAKGPAVITRGDRDRVTSAALDFDAPTDVAVLTGDVVMTSGTDRRVIGDRADFDQRNDTVLVVGGNVVVTQGRNEMKGRRLFVERKIGHTLLTSPAAGATPAGRITARFYQNTSAKPDAAKGGKAAPATTGALPLGLGATTFKTDPNAPIDVEADTLHVKDPDKVATFRGDVRAVQGEFRVRTVELRARYTGQAGFGDAASDKTAKGEKADKAPAQVTKLEARQKVVITSKDNQEATGDWADFDVKTNMATVGGEVVVTRGRDVVRGTRLVIDMTTGESTIVSEAQKDPQDGWAARAPAEGEPKPGAPQPVFTRDRPSAVFYPKQAKDGKPGIGFTTKPKPAATPAPEEAPAKWVPPPAPGERVYQPN